QAWDRQCADSYHPAQGSANHHATAGAGGRTFGGFGMLLVRKIAGSRFVRKKNRYIVLGKSRAHKLIGDINRLILSLGNTEYCFFHYLLPVTDRLFLADCRLCLSRLWLAPWTLWPFSPAPISPAPVASLHRSR